MSAAECRKFSPNIFNRTKCQNCFRTKDAHSAEALESNRATRKASKCGYLFVAPDWDFSVSVNRTKRWQRRWFVLYDDGELTYSVDEHPDTIPQAIIDMNNVIEVIEAEEITGNQYSLALRAPEKIHFIKGTSKEESKWWYDVLSCFPRNTFRGRHKRNTFPSIKSTNISEKSSRGGAEKERFLSDKEWHEMEKTNNIKSEKNIVDMENVNNQLHNNLVSTPTIITIKDKDNINEDVPIKEKAKGVLEGSAEIIKGISRRYLKRENRGLKSQRSRSDGVAKMIPSIHSREFLDDWNQKNCHQNPVYLLLSDVVNAPYQIDKGQEIIKKNNLNKEKSENSLQDSQVRGDPDGCNLDFTCGTKFEDECIKKGWLMRQGVNKEWFKHWFVLKNRSLSYFRDPNTEGSGILDGVLDIGQIKSVEEFDSDRNFAFTITMFDNKRYTLSAVTAGIRKNWVQSILKEAGLGQDVSKSHDILEISLMNEETNDSLSYKEESYLALPPSPLLNRTAISRVKEKARSRSSSRSRNSHRLQNSSILAADSDDSEPLSPRLKECSIDLVDNKNLEQVKNDATPSKASQDKTNDMETMKVIKDYKDLEEKYLLLKKKIDCNEKRFENGDYKLLKSKYETLKLKYKKEKADPELKNNKDNDTEKSKRDSDRKSKKDLEISKLKSLITELQTQCSNQQQIIKENLNELEQLNSFMDQNPKSLHQTGLEYTRSQGDFTYQDSNSSDMNQQAEGEDNPSVKLQKAKEHLHLLKKELLESHKNYDQLEMKSFSFKQQMIKMEEDHDNQMKAMTERVDDLTTKLTTSEKTLRQVRLKLQKLESKQERRRSSLKGKDSMNLSKDYEAKLTELEQKITNLDILNKSIEDADTSASDSFKSTPKKRSDSTSGESSNMIMRLYHLDTMVKSILDDSIDQERPKIRLQIKNIEESSPDEDWSSLSLTTSMPDLHSVDGEEDEPTNSLQSCFEYVEQKLEAALLWLKNNFLSLAQRGSCKEIENIKLLFEYLTHSQVYKNKSRLDVILYNIKVLKEISRCLYRHIKPVNIETIFDVAVEKLNNIFSTILNYGKTCIWTNDDTGKEVTELFVSILPPLVSVFSFKLNKTQINLLESKIKEMKNNYKYISDTWVNQSSTDMGVINISELLTSIQSNISKVFLDGLDKHAFLIDHPTLQSWKEQFQCNFNQELTALHSQILDDPRDLVLKVSSQAYILAAISIIESLVQSSLSEPEPFKPELCHLEDNSSAGTPSYLFILDCPVITESLCISSNYLDLMQLSLTKVACRKCVEIHKQLDSLKESHSQQFETMKKETEELQSSLNQKEESYSNQIQCLHNQLEASQNQKKVLLEEHESQLKCLQEVYSQKLSQNTEIFMDESIRRRYQREIEQLKSLCDKGLTAMENSHKHLIEDLKQKHHQEIQDLKEEKDKLLAEETQATVTALEVIKRAHQQELEQELIRFQQELTKRIKVEPKQQYYISELAEVKKEIVELLDKYSIQCLEKVTLEERLKISSRQLQESNLQILELSSRNKQLRAHLTADISKKLENLPQSSEVSLKHLLEIREQEIAKQQDEITHLKNDLILAQTHVDTLNIHCQELEENRLALREDQLCNLASRLEALVLAASNLDYSNQEVLKDNDKPPPTENLGASGSLKNLNSHPPYWLKSYSCSREMSKAPSYPGLGTYTGSSAWRASPKSTN